MKNFQLVFLLLMIGLSLQAQKKDTIIPKKKYFTSQLNGTITLDGIPSEEAWNAVEWGGDFIQNQPNEGHAPSQQTHFKILYDNQFLYVAYQCLAKSPDSIDKRMGRRDEFPG